MRFLFIALLVGGLLVSPKSASACPDISYGGNEAYRATGLQLNERQSFKVVAGGEFHLSECPGGLAMVEQHGGGWFTEAPDFSFELSEMQGYQLELSVESECDSQLLLTGANMSWYFDDDDNGNLDPRIILTRPANGIIDVWVGTFENAYCDAVLSLQTFRQ